MDDREKRGSGDQRVRLVPSKGSLIGGVSKQKTARITDAMTDLQLGIDGLRSRQPQAEDSKQWGPALAAFARTSSVFLRKTVLGNHNRRETRLLDDDVLKSTNLQFDRLRKIPRNKRREIEVGFGLDSVEVQITKLDDETREPVNSYRFRGGPQELKLSIEWPILGAADWTGVPSKEAPWRISLDQLFCTSAASGLSCDQWLAQQVVLFDGKGISLKEMIRTVANFEAAHAIDVGRLAVVEGEAPSSAAKYPAPHILNAVSLCGVRYAHLVVIECAVYLFEKLLDQSSIERPSGEIYRVTPAVACPPEQAESSQPNWVQFQGGMMVSFSDVPKVIRHKIRAPN